MGLTNSKAEFYFAFEVDESLVKKIDPNDRKGLRLYIEQNINLRDTKTNKLLDTVSKGSRCNK